MTIIAFIGLGNMGNPMAANLVKAGHHVRGFDLMPENLDVAREHGVIVMADASVAVAEADVVITMLPAGKHVLSVYEDIAPKAKEARCSSIARPSTWIRRARRIPLLAGTACNRSTRRFRAERSARRPAR
jgi:3-hydroxyisobutyrate dehydrogenase